MSKSLVVALLLAVGLTVAACKPAGTSSSTTTNPNGSATTTTTSPSGQSSTTTTTQ